MAKVNKSITLDEDIVEKAVKRSVKERRSFSSFIENVISLYLNSKKHK